MTDYDFSCLNDKEFEALVADVLSLEFGQHVERFKQGTDGGVDGRFFILPESEAIIQCKHWLKSGLAALIREIKKSEAAKVAKLVPSRYIFATSLPLSRVNKKEIKSLFSPYIISESDVLGNEDINDLLSSHKEVEKKHYKLWLASTNVLNAIFSSAIIGRSRFKLEEIIEESSLYVPTRNHSEAMRKLESMHSIIITGSPGVGKTTLADQLCRFYAAKGFELVYIENSLNEAEQYYDESREQLFYFDDFLGRNFLLALDRHEDSHVINFMRRVEKDPKKRFILTSRTTILNQGKRLSDLFNIKNINKNEYEIEITSLTELDKAKILYNHIWFSRLEDGYIDQIYLNKRYSKTIGHGNFNPRLISFITDSHRLDGIDSSEYWSYIEKTLDNPKDIWGNVFDGQIDNASKHIVIAVALNGKPLEEDCIKTTFNNLKRSAYSNNFDAQTFDRVMKLLVGALLDRTYSGRSSKIKYDLFNPSIADYVMENYLEDVNYIKEILSCLVTVDSLFNIHGLLTSNAIDEKYFTEVVIYLLKKVDDGKIEASEDYSLRLLHLIVTSVDPKVIPLKIFNKLLGTLLQSDSLLAGARLYDVLKWAIDSKLLDENDEVIGVHVKRGFERWLQTDDFISLSKLINRIEPAGGPLTDLFRENYQVIMSDEITNMVEGEGILSDYFDSNENYHAESEVYDLVSQNIDELSVSFNTDAIQEIAQCCDLDEIIQSNINAAAAGDQEYENWKGSSRSDNSSYSEIDDLFDRS